MKKSKFAKILTALLDDTGLYNREDWAKIFWSQKGYKRTIKDWTKDRAIPRPDQLMIMIDMLQNSSKIKNRHLLDKFSRIASRCATDVSPIGELMLPTIHEYMTRPAFGDGSVLDKLAKMPMEKQAKFLAGRYPNGREG